ncbi:MAG: hypothetical protein ACRDF4_01450, partial [Rhabdochlamydiaceae bacterium]
PEHGKRWALGISCLFAFLSSIYFFAIGAIFAGALFFLLLWENIQSYRIQRDEGNSETHVIALQEVEKMAASGQQNEVIQLLKAFVTKELPKSTLARAYGQLVQVYLQREEIFEAFRVLQEAEFKLRGALPYNLLVMQQLAAYRTSHFPESVQAGNAVFRIRPDLATALLMALTSGQLHKVKESLLWLKTCHGFGFLDFDKLLACSDFDSIRHETAFEQFSVTTGV